MGDEITVPEDHRAAVKMLPPTQKPYDDIALEPKAQSVMFHHNVPKDALKRFLEAVGDNLVSVRMADPDSTDGRCFFDKVTKDFNLGAVHKLKLAIRRLAKDDPLAATFKRAASPKGKSGGSKKSKSSSNSGSADASSSSSAAAAAGDSAAVAKEGSIEYECVSDEEIEYDGAGDDVDDDDDDDDVDKKRKSSGEVKCLNQLFNKVANDVSFIAGVGACVFCVRCFVKPLSSLCRVPCGMVVSWYETFGRDVRRRIFTPVRTALLLWRRRRRINSPLRNPALSFKTISPTRWTEI